MFLPIAADTFGGFGTDAEAVFQTAVAGGKLQRRVGHLMQPQRCSYSDADQESHGNFCGA